jgi:RNA polymerase sigma-70 factor (ECF subfamily)
MAFEGAGLELAYRSHARRLHAVAYHVLHDRHEAEDAVQAALLRVWSSGSYQPERGPLLPFLIACVRREALDIVRGSKRRAERERRVAPPALVPDPTAALDPIEAQRVRAALDRLSPLQRDVIVRAYYGGSTLAEVAHALDVPLGTIKSRLAEALRRLGNELSGGTP